MYKAEVTSMYRAKCRRAGCDYAYESEYKDTVVKDAIQHVDEESMIHKVEIMAFTFVEPKEQ
jgi:hypothetical protein